MVDPTVFRDVLAQWPSGVTVVTTLAGGLSRGPSWHGMTASSFSSVSLTPPLVSICLDRRLYSHGLVSESGVFGISVLAKDQAEVARRFAGMVGDVEDRFAGETWSTAETGVPLLDSALGWLDCRVVHEHDGGDHTIFVGEVLAGHTARKSAPLLFHSRGWGQFADVMPDVATLSDTSLANGAYADRGDDVARISSSLAGAGVRVRVARPTPDVGGSTSMLVADRLTAHQALEAGVDVAELLLDPADPVAVEQALASVDGIADRCSVHLLDAFAPARTESVLSAISGFSAAARPRDLPGRQGRRRDPARGAQPAPGSRGPRSAGADPPRSARPRPARSGQGDHRSQERRLALRHRARGARRLGEHRGPGVPPPRGRRHDPGRRRGHRRPRPPASRGRHPTTQAPPVLTAHDLGAAG